MLYCRELEEEEEAENPGIYHMRPIQALHYRGTLLLGVCSLVQTQVYSNLSWLAPLATKKQLCTTLLTNTASVLISWPRCGTGVAFDLSETKISSLHHRIGRITLVTSTPFPLCGSSLKCSTASQKLEELWGNSRKKINLNSGSEYQ